MIEVVTEFTKYYAPEPSAPEVADNQTDQKGEDGATKSQEPSTPRNDDDDENFVDISSEAIGMQKNKKAEIDNLPRVETRAKAPTAAIVPTPLNNKKVVLKVIDSEIKKGGFFSSDYVLYKVKTEPLGWAVGRKDADFYTLRKILKA